jgi:hypothetical protein
MTGAPPLVDLMPALGLEGDSWAPLRAAGR